MNSNAVDRRTILKSGTIGATTLGFAGMYSRRVKAATSSSTPPALRAEWYDLPTEQGPFFITWFHGDYLPRVKSTAGILWVGHYKIVRKTGEPSIPGGLRRVQTDDPSVPKGSEYVLLTAGVSPETFLAWQSPLSVVENSARDQLASRLSYRQAIFLEELRVDGPDSGTQRDTEAPPAMQLGNFNVRTPDDDLELARYYRLARFPQVAVTIGSIGARKFVSTVGWPKHGVLYEFSSIGPGEQLFETRMNATPPKPPIKLRPVQEYVVHAPNAPHAGPRIWP